MAWMPGVNTSIRANDGNSKLVCNPDVICLHTIVGYAPASAATFSVKSNGYTWQHRDSERQSAANLNGNDHIISIENEDHGPAFGDWNTNDGHAVPDFTAEQIEAIAKICAWGYKEHGIPLVLAKDSKPGTKGIAYHRLGIKSPNNFEGYNYKGWVPGGEIWTNYSGKICPGDRRISQIPQIIKRARQIAGLEPGGGEDELSWEEKLKDGKWTPGGDGTARHAIAFIHQIAERNANLATQIASLESKLKDVSTKLDKIAAPDVDEVALARALVNAGLSSGLTFEQTQSAVLDVLKKQFNK
jgi:N-acetylmuramoyl-L-alanine amidase-like protein